MVNRKKKFPIIIDLSLLSTERSEGEFSKKKKDQNFLYFNENKSFVTILSKNCYNNERKGHTKVSFSTELCEYVRKNIYGARKTLRVFMSIYVLP